MVYLVYYYDTTPAEFSIDRKPHRHKYYACPVDDNLQSWGFVTAWRFTHGKRDAIRFKTKREALRFAKKHGGLIEAVEK